MQEKWGRHSKKRSADPAAKAQEGRLKGKLACNQKSMVSPPGVGQSVLHKSK